MELAQLDAHLTTALAGQGHTVFVAGDAGEGKSLLIEEFVHHAQTAQPELLVAGGHGSSHRGVGDPILPFCEVLAQLTGDEAGQSAAGWRDHDQTERRNSALPQIIDLLLTHAPELLDTLVPRTALALSVTQLLGERPWRQRLSMSLFQF
ncbi:MAG TPA: ATP-binding protein [Caldilineaceae bacterium]|nr:ATP-binding protein [Caldilineaceae bacterium]